MFKLLWYKLRNGKTCELQHHLDVFKLTCSNIKNIFLEYLGQMKLIFCTYYFKIMVDLYVQQKLN